MLYNKTIKMDNFLIERVLVALEFHKAFCTMKLEDSDDAYYAMELSQINRALHTLHNQLKED